jgi:hypothetical protein
MMRCASKTVRKRHTLWRYNVIPLKNRKKKIRKLTHIFSIVCLAKRLRQYASEAINIAFIEELLLFSCM